jgi:hypothetical protein
MTLERGGNDKKSRGNNKKKAKIVIPEKSGIQENDNAKTP